MKKVLSFLACLLIIVSLIPFGSTADAAPLPLVMDYAGVLTETEEAALAQKAETVSDKYGLDVIVLFIDTYTTAGYSDISDYADDFYDQNGYGYGQTEDGLMLVVSLNERATYISTGGKAIDGFTDYGINKIFEDIIPYMKNGNWYSAANRFIADCDDYMRKYNSGTPYDVYNEKRKNFSLEALIADSGIGLLLAGLPLRKKKKEMKSVKAKVGAEDYELRNSFRLTDRNDYFINKTMSRTPIPRNDNYSSGSRPSGMGGSSIHVSSSGHTHGGGGAHF